MTLIMEVDIMVPEIIMALKKEIVHFMVQTRNRQEKKNLISLNEELLKRVGLLQEIDQEVDLGVQVLENNIFL